MADKPHFFISRAGEDAEYAKWVAGVLEDEGYTTILQDLDFLPGDSFIHRMNEALTAAEQVIALLSPSYLAKATYPTLYSLQGYRYCDLLLSQGKTAEVLQRATQTLSWAERHFGFLPIGLDHLSLGSANPPGSAESAAHLNQAADYLRRAGMLEFIPLALLARATEHDLDEVFRIATRSGMRLHLTDYHFAMARRLKSREHFLKAEALIAATGYHRRDAELESLR